MKGMVSYNEYEAGSWFYFYSFSLSNKYSIYGKILVIIHSSDPLLETEQNLCTVQYCKWLF